MILPPKWLSFVGGGFVEGDEVEHGAHSGADAVAIGVFDFGGGEVGGDVGLHFLGYKQIVARQDDFGHDVAFVAEVFQVFLHSQIVKAVVATFLVVPSTVAVDDFVAVFDEFETDVAAGFEMETVVSVGDVFHQAH